MSRRNRSGTRKVEKPERKTVQITNLEQLATQDIDITIQQGEYDLIIPMRTLTFAEWIQVDRDIPMPNPPTMAGPKGMIYDRQAPEYLRAVDEAIQKRMLLRIARSLRIEGLKGTTAEDEIECLQSSMDNTIINGLAQIIQQLHSERNARIEARATSFQRDGQRTASNM